MKLSKLLIGALMLTMIGLTACGKKKDSTSRVADGRQVRGSGQVGTMPNGSQQSGYLVSNSQQFQELVKTLVSPTLDPQFLGQVDPYSGIRAAGAIELSANGSIRSSSAFRLEISDSYTGQVIEGQTIQAYLINLGNGSGTWQGQIVNGSVPNGSANIVFQDQFGTLRINGSWNSSYFTGTVTFRNSANTNKTSLSAQCAQTECPLGQIQLPISAFFR